MAGNGSPIEDAIEFVKSLDQIFPSNTARTYLYEKAIENLYAGFCGYKKTPLKKTH
jgi:hypothetical protein